MKRFVTLALLVLGLLPLSATAQTFKVGYTDPEAIIANMSEYRNMQLTLQREVETGQAELQARIADFQEKVDRYQRQQALLSPESRSQREQELMALEAEIQGDAASREEALGARQAELLQPLLERVQTAIDEVSADKQLALVLRAPAILYINESLVVDITPDVARKLGIPVPEE
jgi:outer membrane protein